MHTAQWVSKTHTYNDTHAYIDVYIHMYMYMCVHKYVLYPLFHACMGEVEFVGENFL